MNRKEEMLGNTPPNTIVFCKRPWKIPAFILTALILLTFVWGFYILDTYVDDDYFDEHADLSVAEFLFRGAANLDIQSVYEAVTPAVVGISGRGVNATVVASGAIVGPGGYVITAGHGVTNLPEINIHVRTPNGIKRYGAQVVKTLATHDLVLLKMLTAERFVYFTLADSVAVQPGEPVFGFGHGLMGNAVVRQGSIIGKNVSINIGQKPLTHLFGTDAVYTWEQSGGPLVNASGELLGVNLALQGGGRMVDGYAVPSHVIVAHFQDILTFRKAAPQSAGPGQAAAVNVARTIQQPGSGPSQAPGVGSSSWWAKARAQVAGDNAALGINAVAGAGPMPPTGVGGGAAAGSAGGSAATDWEHLSGFRIAGYSVADIAGLAMLALVAGITGGMMTMGGGVLQVAGMMVFFGYGMYLIRPVAYLTNIFVYGAAALHNNRSGLIVWPMVRSVAPWAVAGVIAGYFIGNEIDDDGIGIILGIFATLMVLKGLLEIFSHQSEEMLVKGNPGKASNGLNPTDVLDELLDDELQGKGEEQASRPSRDHIGDVVLGLPMGLVSGILGISGGVVAVPVQRLFANVPLHNAIANSSILVFWASSVGAIVAFVHGVNAGLIEWEAPVTLAMIMIPGAYIGGILGAKLMKILPAIALKWFYTAIMAAIAIRMLILG